MVMATTMTTTMMRRRQMFDMFLTTKSIYEASVHKLHTGWLYNAKRYKQRAESFVRKTCTTLPPRLLLP